MDSGSLILNMTRGRGDVSSDVIRYPEGPSDVSSDVMSDHSTPDDVCKLRSLHTKQIHSIQPTWLHEGVSYYLFTVVEAIDPSR